MSLVLMFPPLDVLFHFSAVDILQKGSLGLLGQIPLDHVLGVCFSASGCPFWLFSRLNPSKCVIQCAVQGAVANFWA